MKDKKNENLSAIEEEVLIAQEGNESEEILAQAQSGEETEAMQENTSAAEENDFQREMMELLEKYPELRERLKNGEGMPQEMLMACAKDGVSLQVAYAEYQMKQAQAQAEQLRKENEILRRNAAAIGKAPVKGATLGGSTGAKGRDPFLVGLLGDE